MPRLAVAAGKALAEWATTHALVLVPEAEGHRGGSVPLTNEHLTIRIVPDWLEGELDVTVQQNGDEEVALSGLVDLSRARALSLTRLSRGISEEAVARRLRQIAALLDEEAAPIFTRGT
ncbi:MAG: hypothetical protein KDA94_04120 [Acidimicrobiales bacterium]|nr:hypothetical protein [Acidimicrobiales bacterium]